MTVQEPQRTQETEECGIPKRLNTYSNLFGARNNRRLRQNSSTRLKCTVLTEQR